MGDAVEMRLPDGLESERPVMTGSLVLHAFAKLAQPQGGIEYSYQPQSHDDGGKILWYLRLGSFNTSGVEDPAKLRAMADAHRRLATEMVNLKVVKDMVAAHRSTLHAVVAFKESLSPNASLRNSILRGRCDECS